MVVDPNDPPPRRPKPARDPARPRPGPPGEGDSTFQPSARPAGATGKRRAPKAPIEVVGKPGWVERLVFGSVGTAHLATFCRQAAAYLDAGVDLIKSLGNLETQFARSALGPVLGRLQLAVRRGDALAEAMAREPQAFDSLFLSMMKVAEARGGVPETLRLMADHYDARLRLIRQARSALIYPVVVLVIASGVVALLTYFVLPVFVSLLEDFAGRGQADIPMPTRIRMGFSRFVQSHGWWAIPLAIAAAVFALTRAYRTPSGKSALDELALRIPVLGKLLRMIETTRFARTLSALLEGGVDIGTSIDLTADVVRLVPFRRALRGARTAVMEGTELSRALRISGRFGPDVVAIVDSGEETGKLPESLAHLADDYEEQVAYMVKNLGSLIQPLILVGMGGIVLFIVLAVILPYIAMISSLTK